MTDFSVMDSVNIPLFEGISRGERGMLFGHIMPTVREFDKDEIIIIFTNASYQT